MCGITGFLAAPAPAADLERTVAAMARALAHRGPDDAGTWADPEAGLALGHRRLSILDLSPLGHQPMLSSCGRYVLCYNGEAYNHLDLRRELEAEGVAFRGGSDTETLVEAVARWGLRPAVERLVGMFAFALWDRQERVLALVRDRLGIKPLYYGRMGGGRAGGLLFGSELKALRAHPGFDAGLDRNALALYFRHNYIPAPHSAYQGVKKLPPGAIALFGPGGHGSGEERIETYWSAREVWQRGADHPFSGSEEEAAAELEALLSDAVSMRMLADVPLGAFLSGGIDSSTVVALMQERSARPVKTFSIGFYEQEFNEAGHAKAVAAHLGTDHVEQYLTPQDLLDVVPRIPEYWDEPFSDSSQIPTYCVCRMAREQVTVALSGDGGDELFSGYERYFHMNSWNALKRVPRPLRRMLAAGLKGLPSGLFRALGPVGPKLQWRLDILGSKDFKSYYRYFLSHWKRPDEFVRGGREPVCPLTDPASVLHGDLYQQMSFWDLVSYLPDDILTKVDRASMAVGLEARVPLLDHRVVELAGSLPTAMKVDGKVGKKVLRRVLHRHVPPELVERPKVGFGVPIERWLGNELRDWCESLLAEDRLRGQGLLDADMVRRMWREYLAGQRNWHYYLWDVLMLQSWLEHARPSI